MQPNLVLAQHLAGLSAHHKKRYCYPSQEKILEQLEKFYGLVMSRRTLCRHLALLEAGGWITRVCRHQNDIARGGWTFRSTLYKIGPKLWRHLARLGKAVAQFAGFSRVPSMAHNDTSSRVIGPASPSAPPGRTKSVPPPGWAAGVQQLLHKK